MENGYPIVSLKLNTEEAREFAKLLIIPRGRYVVV